MAMKAETEVCGDGNTLAVMKAVQTRSGLTEMKAEVRDCRKNKPIALILCRQIESQLH